MPDYTHVLEILEEIRQLAATPEVDAKINAAQQELGLLDAEASEPSKVIPPSGQAPGFEIFGGVETTRFPDCCAIGNADYYSCSGTLIAPTVVVTARHCDEGITRVFLKGGSISDLATGEEIPVVAEYAHPEVDLRVLVLAYPSTVTPCHVAQGHEVYAPAQVVLAGFGTIDANGEVGYGTKREVAVELTSLDCSAPGDFLEYGCKEGTELVAGHRGLGLDSCNGDSGGPLYIPAPYTEDSYYLLGATSRGIRKYGSKCGDGGVYVRVDKCLDWIRQVTGVDIEGPS